MDTKKETKRYLVFYDVEDRNGKHPCDTHPLELSYKDNPIKTLIDKNVPIHKVYCLDKDSRLIDMEDFTDDFNHEVIYDEWWSIVIESTDDEVMKWLWCEDGEDEEEDENEDGDDE